MALANTVPVTNALPAGRRIRDLLAVELDGTVDVDYGSAGRDQARDTVWVGRSTATHDHLTFRGGARRPRRETLTVEVHLEAVVVGGTPEDAAARAQTLGQVIETVLAGNDTLAGLPGVVRAGVSDVEHQPGYADDETAVCRVTYRVVVESVLQ